MNIKLFSSASIEEVTLAHAIATTGNEELLDAAPAHVSRSKVLMLAAVMQREIVACLIHE